MGSFYEDEHEDHEWLQGSEEPDYMIGLSIEDIYLMYECVKKRLETWEGYPQRPAEEQEQLWSLRDNLYRMILDYKFREM
jgi:hypothetical protein